MSTTLMNPTLNPQTQMHAIVHRTLLTAYASLTNRYCNNCHNQKVKVGDPSKLLEQVLRQECDKRILC